MRSWKDDATNVLIVGYVILIICAIISICSCNPVKQVLKDKAKLDKVAEVVVQNGYCANDTTIITKSDTTILHDTTYSTDTLIEKLTTNDTTYVKIKVPTIITRTITIRDTITNVVVDGARILLCEKRLSKSEESRLEYKNLAKKRWWYLFWLILFLIVLLLRKPVMKLIRWHLLP